MNRAAAVLLAAVVAALVLLIVSRSQIFEPVNGYVAAGLGWSGFLWTVQSLLPLLVAAGLTVAGLRSPTALALGAGVAAGAALNQLAQLVTSGLVAVEPDVDYGVGPAWWLILVAFLLLVAGAMVVARRWHGRPQLRRDPRAIAGGALLVAAAALWVLAPPVDVEFGWWSFLAFPGLVLTAACLPLVALRLPPGQRLFGLATVTTAAAWLVAGAVGGLVSAESGSSSTGVALRALAGVLSLLAVGLAAARASAGARPPEAATRR